MTVTTQPISRDSLAASNGHARALVAATGKVGGVKKGSDLTKLDAGRWQKWSKWLAQRKSPEPIDKLTGGKTHPAFWAGASVDNDAEVLFANPKKPAKGSVDGDTAAAKFVARWLASTTATQGACDDTLLASAVAYALPNLARQLPQATWCELLTHLIDLAEHAAAMSADDSALAHQLLAGELPWTLAGVLPEVAACRDLAEAGQTALEEGILSITDGEGVPHAAHLPHARGLLACWTRVQLLGQATGTECFDEDAHLQYEWLVRQSLRLARTDGSQMLTDDVENKSDKYLFAAALKLAGDDSDTAAARLALPSMGKLLDGKSNSKGRKKKDEPALADTATFSDWACAAVLRTNWTRKAATLAVLFDEPAIRSELHVGGQTLWQGDCTPQLNVAGRALQITDSWEEVCWFSDDDCDYLELQAELTGGVLIQRQFLLAREDDFLLVADAILGEDAEQIEYRCTWPVLSSGRTAKLNIGRADETRECNLFTSKPLANIYPLALGEWRSDGRQWGELTPGDDGLTLTASAHAPRLYVPLWLDLKSSRLGKPFTWRQLSIGDQLTRVDRASAVGYRVQSSNKQWLIYRSLAEIASRTVLGQNLYNEFLVARFDKHGEADTIIEIE